MYQADQPRLNGPHPQRQSARHFIELEMANALPDAGNCFEFKDKRQLPSCGCKT